MPNISSYEQFLASKRLMHRNHGRDVSASAIHGALYDFQRDTVCWALRKGRAAIWQTTGLGKTVQQLEWARQVGGLVLIVAPLAVAQQTVMEAQQRLGITARFVRSSDELDSHGIYTTNYEMLHAFIGVNFDGMVLDESSILASIDGKTRKLILEAFTDVPYRLSCTATPMPNDITELAGQAQFLGVMRREEMLATFFVHDETGWRLRGHAKRPFYRWLASWAIAMNNPADLGYDGSAFMLPPLEIREHVVETAWTRPDALFPGQLKGIADRADVRRQSISDRVRLVANLVNNTDEQVIVWTGLNDEVDACLKAIPDAVSVNGTDPLDQKIERILGFRDGRYRVMVSKPKVAGFGLNLQNCHRQVFMGLGDSWQQYYQAIRRCWRYRQQHPVIVDIVVTDHEVGIVENVKRKERESLELVNGMIEAAKEFTTMELRQTVTIEDYDTKDYEGDTWRVMQGDACERLQEIPDETIDLSVYSPPFINLYQYSATERDLGNSRDEAVFFEHFGFIIQQLLRVTKPGRVSCCHVSQVPAMLVRDGYIGLKDFRGKTIACFEDHGWIYHGEVCIWKNPQSQSIRTHSKGLAFTQLKKDSSWLRPGLADYVLVFRKPGENAVPIHPDIDNDTWIKWASPIWFDINETRTLDVQEARSGEDDKHICALQLDVIERCIRLWSNPGETVLSPFGGIGSEGAQAIRLGRRAILCELKPLYARTAARNCRRAEEDVSRQLHLFGNLAL
ncbi:MAG TPA: DNA methyltransferase [Alphaproteobacteria bacterium]|nr:DNA methyltransferase [Alphaproteobacteria bacterium]